MSLDLPRARVYGGGVGSVARWRADGKIFREGDAAVRYRGVSAFQLLDRFAAGQDITPFCRAYAGFNVLRIWPYVPTPPGIPGWTPPPNPIVADCIRACAAEGFHVELTLLTDDDPGRLSWALRLIDYLSGEDLPGLLLEAGNEPRIHKDINTQALKAALERSQFLYTSGEYVDMTRFYGRYIVSHTERDGDWPRRAHDLFDYSETDGGPHMPGPRLRMPAVADEPIRPDLAGYNLQDFRAYFGACAILGAGATFHSESGKTAALPTELDARCAAAALEGLTVFPADAPLGPYARPADDSLRTYLVGNYMVRVRPRSPDAPHPGWTARDADHILWTR